PDEASTSNPVDMLGSAVGSTYRKVLPILLRDPGVDSVIVLFVPPVVAGAEEVAQAISAAVSDARDNDKPVLACVISAQGMPEQLLSAPLAAFSFPESAARALGRVADRAEWLRAPQGRVPELAGIDTPRAEELVANARRPLARSWRGACAAA